MDRKRLIDKELRRRAKRPNKSNSAFKSQANFSSSKPSSELSKPHAPKRSSEVSCIYSDVKCKRFYKEGSRSCITSKNFDGSNSRCCPNVPIEKRAPLTSWFRESIKNGAFEENRKQ